MKTRTAKFNTEMLLPMTKQDREALADRARLENKSSNEIARIAIRAYLAHTSPKKESAAA